MRITGRGIGVGVATFIIFFVVFVFVLVFVLFRFFLVLILKIIIRDFVIQNLQIILINQRVAFKLGKGGFEVNDIAQWHNAIGDLITPMHQRANGQWRFTNATNHHFTSSFNPFCNGDFAFTR